jgi:integrase
MLTEAKLKNARCPSDRKRIRLADDGGLYLEVTPASARWFWKYRLPAADASGKPKLIEKRLALGSYPAVSIKAARSARDAARLALRGGMDPAQQRKVERNARRLNLGNTFEAVARGWHADWKGARSERHARYVLRRLEMDAFPVIGATPVADVTAPMLIAMAKRIESRDALHLSKRTLQSCGQILRYAVAHGLIERNPAADFKPLDVLKQAKATSYARVDARELPELLRKMEAYGGAPHTRFAMKLMALTFVRTGELIAAQWDEFEDLDGEAPTWRIPAERMKMRTEHLVPLSTQAVAVLSCLSEIRGPSAYVFPGERDRKSHISNGTILVALKRMGYAGRMTGHGFRSVASTVLHELGWRHDLIELQLAHLVGNAVSRAYNTAQHLPERRKLLQAWADHLDTLRDDRRVIAGRFGRVA